VIDPGSAGSLAERDLVGRLRDRAGPELVERLLHLDAVREARRVDRALAAPAPGDAVDVDVVMAGGGLSLLVAAELGRLGLRVLVVERARAGRAHREWNASRAELEPLVATGIVTSTELEALVVARYREGICQFHGGPPRVVRGVLDHAVAAGDLLERVREVATARGVRFVEGAEVDGVGVGQEAVRVGFRDAGAGGEITARVLVDARGASSPHATADLVCPTVGGVMRGLRQGDGPREVRSDVGEILVTTEGAAPGPCARQHVWEGFPGRPGELTVYLFYYASAASVGGPALLPLYARFFETLATYKEGEAELVRPTFGFIPGWSRLTPPPRPPSPRIVLVGDAAARHSPLTFCGFGSMLRTFQPVAAAIASALDAGVLPPEHVVPEDGVHAWTGALAQVMASGALQGDSLCRLLDDAFGVLEEMGNDDFAALLQDRMSGSRFTEFLRRTGRRHRPVYREVLSALGPRAAARWGARLFVEVARASSLGPRKSPKGGPPRAWWTL